jgi:uncharacterized protein
MRPGRCLAALLLAALLSSATSSAGLAAAATHESATWVDEPVTFVAGGITIYATLRHLVGAHMPVPGVLLIAGSGPTDRNGNSAVEPGPIDTLKTLADWLSEDGVASLRYDKLGSGRTGVASYAANPARIGIAPFEQESLAALRFLAARRGIDDRRLGVFGHSEGALFALLLATGKAGRAPPIHALGLVEPLSLRYLTVITIQVKGQVEDQVRDGIISAALGNKVDDTLARAVTQLRRSGTVPADLPYGLSTILNPSTALFLSQADRYDPAALAAELPAETPVLVTCSSSDLQVTCGEVAHLANGLSRAHADIDFVRLKDVDHVLKVDPSGSTSDYAKSLPFSPRLRSALANFVARHLDG